MKLVQKLPMGLALAACMMMSSCSQEDVAQPEKGRIENGFSSKRGGGPLQGVPQIPTTSGSAGDNIFAKGWEKYVHTIPDNLEKYATGTSTASHLWGNASFPWLKPLSLFAGCNFVTFMSQKGHIDFNSYSKVQTTLKNLKPGKQYAVKLYASSTVRMLNGQPTQYALGVNVSFPGGNEDINLIGKEAEWVSKTITFTATASEESFFFRTSMNDQFFNSQNKFFQYAHILVPQDAITEL